MRLDRGVGLAQQRGGLLDAFACGVELVAVHGADRGRTRLDRTP